MTQDTFQKFLEGPPCDRRSRDLRKFDLDAGSVAGCLGKEVWLFFFHRSSNLALLGVPGVWCR